jgi:DNA-binding LytR/AlgR family response regulator
LHLSTNPCVLIIENESPANRQLVNVIKQTGLTPLGPVNSREAAKAIYQEKLPPLIMLNVQLDAPQGASSASSASSDGIELAYELIRVGARSEVRRLPVMVFTTDAPDHQTFARASALRPLAYLEKPYPPGSLQHVLQLALARTEPVLGLRMIKAPQVAAGPAMLVPPTQGTGSGSGYLFVREGGRLVRLDPADITCVHVEEKYCVIVTGTGRRHSVRVPLADLLRQLGLSDFVRIHRSWLINLNRVEYIDPVESIVHMKGGTEAPLGRSFRTDLLQALPMLE